MKNVEQLIAYLGAYVSPCEKFSCSCRSLCGAELLACESFLHFVRSGNTAHPKTAFFVDEDGRLKPRKKLDESAYPTHEVYEKAMAADWTEQSKLRQKRIDSTMASVMDSVDR